MNKANLYNTETLHIKDNYYLDIVFVNRNEESNDDSPNSNEYEAWIYAEDSEIKEKLFSLPAEPYMTKAQFITMAINCADDEKIKDYSIRNIDGYKEWLEGGEELHNYTMMLPPVKYNLKLVSETDILIGTAYIYKNHFYEVMLSKMDAGEITVDCKPLKNKVLQPKIRLMNDTLYLEYPLSSFESDDIDKLQEYLKAAKITVEEIEKKIKSLDK